MITLIIVTCTYKNNHVYLIYLHLFEHLQEQHLGKCVYVNICTVLRHIQVLLTTQKIT